MAPVEEALSRIPDEGHSIKDEDISPELLDIQFPAPFYRENLRLEDKTSLYEPSCQVGINPVINSVLFEIK